MFYICTFNWAKFLDYTIIHPSCGSSIFLRCSVTKLKELLRIKKIFLIIVFLNHDSLTAQVARDPARCPHAVWKLLAVPPGFNRLARITVIYVRTYD